MVSSRRRSIGNLTPGRDTPRIAAKVGVLNVESAFGMYAISVNGVEMLQTSLVVEALRSMGLNPLETRMQSMIRSMDVNNTGFVSKKAFCEFAESQEATNYTHKDLEEMFHAFDENKTGYIEAQDFRNIYTGATGTALNEHEADDLMTMAQRGTGKVSIADFLTLMCPKLEVINPVEPVVVEEKTHNEYIDKLLDELRQVKSRSLMSAESSTDDVKKWISDISKVEQQLTKAKNDVDAAFGNEGWQEVSATSAYSPLANEGLKQLCELKLLAISTDAKEKVGVFYENEKRYIESLAALRGEAPAPLIYDESMENIRQALKKLHQLKYFMKAHPTVVPPGLFHVPVSEKWSTYDQEEATREELCDAYLSGLAGRDIGPKVRATASVRSAHSLGVGRKFNGNILSTAKTDISFRSVEVEGRLFSVEDTFFMGKTIHELIPRYSTDDVSSITRTFSTFGGVNALSSCDGQAGSEVEGKKLCEEKGYKAFVNNKAGQNTFYSDDTEAIAKAMTFSGEGDCRIVFHQKLTPEEAAVQNAYEAGLMNEAPPTCDEAYAFKASFAFAVGELHRHEILTSCSPKVVNMVGELYIGHVHCDNINEMLAYDQVDSEGNLKMSPLLFGQLTKEMDITYGGMQIEMKDEFQRMVKDYELLQQRHKAYGKWLEEKPELDRKAREGLEKEEADIRAQLEADEVGEFNSTSSKRETTKPAPPPPTPAKKATPPPPKPKPVEIKPPPAPKPKEAKGCC